MERLHIRPILTSYLDLLGATVGARRPPRRRPIAVRDYNNTLRSHKGSRGCKIFKNPKGRPRMTPRCSSTKREKRARFGMWARFLDYSFICGVKFLKCWATTGLLHFVQEPKRTSPLLLVIWIWMTELAQRRESCDAIDDTVNICWCSWEQGPARRQKHIRS